MIGRPIEYRGVRDPPPANKWELERLRRIEEAHRAKARSSPTPAAASTAGIEYTRRCRPSMKSMTRLFCLPSDAPVISMPKLNLNWTVPLRGWLISPRGSKANSPARVAPLAHFAEFISKISMLCTTATGAAA